MSRERGGLSETPASAVSMLLRRQPPRDPRIILVETEDIARIWKFFETAISGLLDGRSYVISLIGDRGTGKTALMRLMSLYVEESERLRESVLPLHLNFPTSPQELPSSVAFELGMDFFVSGLEHLTGGAGLTSEAVLSKVREITGDAEFAHICSLLVDPSEMRKNMGWRMLTEPKFLGASRVQNAVRRVESMLSLIRAFGYDGILLMLDEAGASTLLMDEEDAKRAMALLLYLINDMEVKVQGLLLVLGCTPPAWEVLYNSDLSDRLGLRHRLTQTARYLGTLTREQARELVNKLENLFSEAYGVRGFKLSEQEFERVFSDSKGVPGEIINGTLSILLKMWEEGIVDKAEHLLRTAVNNWRNARPQVKGTYFQAGLAALFEVLSPSAGWRLQEKGKRGVKPRSDILLSVDDKIIGFECKFSEASSTVTKAHIRSLLQDLGSEVIDVGVLVTNMPGVSQGLQGTLDAYAGRLDRLVIDENATLEMVKLHYLIKAPVPDPELQERAQQIALDIESKLELVERIKQIARPA